MTAAPVPLARAVRDERSHPRTAACSVFTAAGHACGYSPSSRTHDFFWNYAAQVERLAGVFPRGRFKRDVDGTAILVPRSRRWTGCHLYEQAPGRLVGLAYTGRPEKVTNRVRRHVVKHIGGDGEGVFHLRWTPELARLLPTFSRGAQGGSARFRSRPEGPATDEKGAQDSPQRRQPTPARADRSGQAGERGSDALAASAGWPGSYGADSGEG